MHRFIARHAQKITGVLNGFDRLVLRGRLLPLCHEGGVRAFLASQGVLLKEFGCFVETVTGMIRDAAVGVIDRLGRPSRYLQSSRISKEEVALRFLVEHGLDQKVGRRSHGVEQRRQFRVMGSLVHDAGSDGSGYFSDRPLDTLDHFSQLVPIPLDPPESLDHRVKG